MAVGVKQRKKPPFLTDWWLLLCTAIKLDALRGDRDGQFVSLIVKVKSNRLVLIVRDV